MWKRNSVWMISSVLLLLVLLVISIVLKSRQDVKNLYASLYFDSSNIHLMKVEFAGMSFSSGELLSIEYTVGEKMSAKDGEYRRTFDAEWNLRSFDVNRIHAAFQSPDLTLPVANYRWPPTTDQQQDPP